MHLFDDLALVLNAVEAQHNEPYSWREDGKIFLSLDLPGYEKGNISVIAEEGILTIHAKCGEKSRRREYMRRFSLPKDADPEKSTANYDNGVLTISLPVIENKAGKRIPIT